MKKITVLGGVTMDLLYSVPEFPQAGKTVEATKYSLTPGGKAFNTATALKRLGFEPILISSVGKDNFSEEIFETILEEQIATDTIVVQDNVPTDVISVIVSPEGKRGLIGTRSANYALKKADIDQFQKTFEATKALIATLEIPYTVALHAFKLAKQNNIPTILNPSPFEHFSTDIFDFTHHLIINEKDAYLLAGLKDGDTEEKMIEFYRTSTIPSIFIFKDEKGCTSIHGNVVKHYTSFPGKRIDNTGSLDAFCATLTASLLEKQTEDIAIRKALAAATFVAEKSGGRTAMPTEHELSLFLQQNTKVTL